MQNGRRASRRVIRIPVRHTDSFEITEGSLGPVGPCKLDIRPLTVFVGKQGTGKSLVAQVLYALEELPFLTQYIMSREQDLLGSRPTANRVFSAILDRLRSSDRRFATFASKHLEIAWKRSARWEGLRSIIRRDFRFRVYHANRLVTLLNEHTQLIEALQNPALRPRRHAVFIPTERMVVSQLGSALAANVLRLPITYELFADWLELQKASGVDQSIDAKRLHWDMDHLGRAALGGRERRYGKRWLWICRDEDGESKQFDLDMASSGQRANWSLVYLARMLSLLRGHGDIGKTVTLFIEEPEIHLHPEAQKHVAWILARLVRSGFRVVATTHSLTLLYALNNLLLAHQRFGDDEHRKADLPPPRFRLPARHVSVYAFGGDTPRQLLDPGSAFIDEHELGDIGADLGAEMNFLANYDPKA